MDAFLVNIYNFKLVRKLLLIQLFTLILISSLFGFKNIIWAISSFAGGMISWIANLLFIILTYLLEKKRIPSKKNIILNFALSEFLKIFFNIIFLILALSTFGAIFWPLIISWLLMLVVQIVTLSLIID